MTGKMTYSDHLLAEIFHGVDGFPTYLTKEFTLLLHLAHAAVEKWNVPSSSVWLAVIIALFLMLVNSTWNKSDSSNVGIYPPHTREVLRRPPIVPSWTPFLGNLIPFLKNGPESLSDAANKIGWTHPMGLRLGPITIYFFTSPQHVSTLLKSSNFDTYRMVLRVMGDVLGMTQEDLTLHARDRSGPLSLPRKGTRVPPTERVRHFLWKAAYVHLSKARLPDVINVYQARYTRQLTSRTQITSEWSTGQDFSHFVRSDMLRANMETFFGDYIFRFCPDLETQLQDFLLAVPSFLRPYPNWMLKRQKRNRDALLKSIGEWIEFLDREGPSFEEISHQDPMREPYFGSKFTREVHRINAKIYGLNLRARACAVLGQMLGVTINALSAGLWTVYEVYRDPFLLAEVREIVSSSCETDDRTPGASIFQSPLLQSIFHEVLRLYTHGIMVTKLEQDLVLDEWIVPKGAMVGISSTISSRNPDNWNTGAHNEWPPTKFWSRRFIVDPEDITTKQVCLKSNSQTPEQQRPYFTLKGSEGKLFSFGAGPRQCPGRHFAQQEVLVTLALLVAEFDIEFLVPTGWEPRMETNHFPLGILPPKDKIPFRIRRRGLAA